MQEHHEGHQPPCRQGKILENFSGSKCPPARGAHPEPMAADSTQIGEGPQLGTGLAAVGDYYWRPFLTLADLLLYRIFRRDVGHSKA